jgi:hypothetical protein
MNMVGLYTGGLCTYHRLPRGSTPGLLLRGRNKTLTKPLGTGEISLMTKIMLQPPTPREKTNIMSLTETIYYITGELQNTAEK